MTFITTPCYLNVASGKGGFWGQKKLFSERFFGADFCPSFLSTEGRPYQLTNRNDDPIDNVPVGL